MDEVSQTIHEALERYIDAMTHNPEAIYISKRTAEKLQMECYVPMIKERGDVPYFEGIRIRISPILADYDNKEPNGVPWLYIGEDVYNRRVE